MNGPENVWPNYFNSLHMEAQHFLYSELFFFLY